MIRLSPPGCLRFIQTDSFLSNYTGAEANSCVSLSQYGMNTQIVTKVPDNDIAMCALATMRKFGVQTDHVVYGGTRLGSYYLERGASQRPSRLIYDRKYSAFSESERGDYDWDTILEGADALLFSGITAALSEKLPDICADACIAARKKGVMVFCDLNYRATLWSPERAQAVMSRLAEYVDVIIGNEEDADKSLGIRSNKNDVTRGKLDKDSYAEIADKICQRYGCKEVAFTLRGSLSASDNTWAGLLYSGGESYFSKEYLIHMVDRVGGGDSFTAGLIYALLQEYDKQEAIEFAVAASCLKQTMELDFNLAKVPEVHRLMNGDGSGRVQR